MTSEQALEILQNFRKNFQTIVITEDLLKAIEKAIEIVIIEVTKQKAKSAGAK